MADADVLWSPATRHLPCYEGTAERMDGKVITVQVWARDRAHAIQQVLDPDAFRYFTITRVLTMEPLGF